MVFSRSLPRLVLLLLRTIEGAEVKLCLYTKLLQSTILEQSVIFMYVCALKKEMDQLGKIQKEQK